MSSGRDFLTDVEVPYTTSGSYHSNRRSGVIPYIGFLTDVVYYVSIYYVGLETNVGSVI